MLKKVSRMKLFKKSERTFNDLPAKAQKEMLLKAAKTANEEQKTLENRYLKLQTPNK